MQSIISKHGFIAMSARCDGDEINLPKAAALRRFIAEHYPHPEERPLGRVSKDGRLRLWPSFETRARARSSG
jgi:hypothetical protein